MTSLVIHGLSKQLSIKIASHWPHNYNSYVNGIYMLAKWWNHLMIHFLECLPFVKWHMAALCKCMWLTLAKTDFNKNNSYRLREWDGHFLVLFMQRGDGQVPLSSAISPIARVLTGMFHQTENPWQHSFVLIVTSATGLVELSLRFALFRMCSLGRRCVALMWPLASATASAF